MIKINFTDFWPGFSENNLFLKFMEKHFSVIVDDKPDYLFYSVYGNRHLNYDDAVKILYTGENLVPDFNLCDYALGFHYLDFEDRYMRFPLYAYYQWHYEEVFKRDLSKMTSSVDFETLSGRKFCNFVYSNNVNSDPVRDSFFYALSKYKEIDSGGRHLNNIGGPVSDKLQFIKDYKFTIAFENSSVPGYTTEKLLEPILMKSLPVYFGNPLVDDDFITNSFIRVEGKSDFDRAINEIISLDKDDDKYITMLEREKFKLDNNKEVWEQKLKMFLKNIFEQPRTSAFRRSVYGFNNYYLGEIKMQSQLLEIKRNRISLKASIKRLLTRPFSR